MIGRTEGYSSKAWTHTAVEATEKQSGSFGSDKGDSKWRLPCESGLQKRAGQGEEHAMASCPLDHLSMESVKNSMLFDAVVLSCLSFECVTSLSWALWGSKGPLLTQTPKRCLPRGKAWATVFLSQRYRQVRALLSSLCSRLLWSATGMVSSGIGKQPEVNMQIGNIKLHLMALALSGEEGVHFLGSIPWASAIPDSFQLPIYTDSFTAFAQPFPRPPYMSHSLWSHLSPTCSWQQPPSASMASETKPTRNTLLYPSLLNFLKLVPCLLSMCLPRAKQQVYRECYMNSEINEERNDVGEDKFFFFSLFILSGLNQCLVL